MTSRRSEGEEAKPGFGVPHDAGGEPCDEDSRGQDMDARLDELARLIANSPHNLVAASQRHLIRDVHIVEALEVGKRLPLQGHDRWLDLGTGGGLPGLVLSQQHPSVTWTLLDSTRKKISEVQRFAEDLRLHNVVAISGRAEEVAHHAGLRGVFDGVVSRAVAPLVVLVELARGFLAAGGVLAAIKGPGWGDELRSAQRALRTLCYRDDPQVVELPTVRPTWLVTIAAEGEPPSGYPRRAGVPKRQPLGLPRSRGGRETI